MVVDPQGPAETAANTQELRLLCNSAGVVLADEMHIRRRNPDPRFFIGKGNAEEAYVRVQDSEATLVVVGADLSATQQRNIEEAATVRVVDRTQLILDIFAQRARSNEGKLQVELAQLEYLLPRLAGQGTEMSRIGGSSGGVATRGPGETKLETDRRRVRKRISNLKSELEAVVKHRAVQNTSRRRLVIPSAALVGYTSAGKSTLLNLLSGADVETHAQLFATLDPTTRRVDLENGSSVLLSDTVGFVQNLPHHLVAAFRATLEEVVDADFLIHVVDSSHPYVEQQRASVMTVLSELGAQDKPMITVFNKSDAVEDQYELRRLVAETENSCYMSALTGDGAEYLEELIGKMVSQMLKRVEVMLPFERGDLLGMCHERGRVISTDYRGEGVLVKAEVSPDLAARLSPYSTIEADAQE